MKGTSFTHRYNLTVLIYFEEYPDPAQAIAREKQLKGWTRAKKEALIAKMNPEWRDLIWEFVGHEPPTERPPLHSCPEIPSHPERSARSAAQGAQSKDPAAADSALHVSPRGPSTPLRSAQDDCALGGEK
jgi:hypothetical protein